MGVQTLPCDVARNKKQNSDKNRPTAISCNCQQVCVQTLDEADNFKLLRLWTISIIQVKQRRKMR